MAGLDDLSAAIQNAEDVEDKAKAFIDGVPAATQAAVDAQKAGDTALMQQALDAQKAGDATALQAAVDAQKGADDAAAAALVQGVTNHAKALSDSLTAAGG